MAKDYVIKFPTEDDHDIVKDGIGLLKKVEGFKYHWQYVLWLVQEQLKKNGFAIVKEDGRVKMVTREGRDGRK